MHSLDVERRTKAATVTSAPRPVSRTCVLINAVHARSGGGVTYLRNILPLLAKDPRLDLHLFLFESQIEIFHPIDQNVRVHAFEDIVGSLWMMAWEQLALPILGRIMGVDVIFSPANFGCLLSSRNVILLRNALSVIRVESRPSRWLYWGALTLATSLSILRSKKVIAVSRYAAKVTYGLARVPASKTTVVYHGVSPRFMPAPEIVRERFILIVADIYVQKNLLKFFSAAEKICRRYPDIRIKVVGAPIDPWYYKQVLSLIERLGINEQVEFLGWQPVERILDLYRRCLFLVFPSTAETFGNPLVEAMACGTAIACSHASAMPEIVADAAVLFDPFDPHSNADACLKLIESEELRAELSARGIARSKMFLWDKSGHSVANILVEVGESIKK